MEHVAPVRDALTARPADLFYDVRDRLGDHHVARSERQAPPEGLHGLLGAAGGKDGMARSHHASGGSSLDTARAGPEAHYLRMLVHLHPGLDEPAPEAERKARRVDRCGGREESCASEDG